MAPRPDEYPPYLTSAMVAEMLQMQEQMVRRLARSGVIPAIRIPGTRAYRFDRDKLLEWLESDAVNPQLQPDNEAEAEEEEVVEAPPGRRRAKAAGPSPPPRRRAAKSR